MSIILKSAFECLQKIQIIFNNIRMGPEPLYALAYPQPSYKTTKPFSVKDLIGDGFLWAVPRNRRTIEKRLKRKFGSPEYVWKMLKPKTNLRSCSQCGSDHEVGVLCPTCYKKVKLETESMQEKIQSALGTDKIEQDVIVLYEGENSLQTSEFLNGKRVVEMDKPRPMWFSKNLMQKSTKKPAITKEVKPTDLG